MRINFELKDEITVTNTTVKVTTWISGQVGEDDRPALETKAREIISQFLPDADLKWAFSNFTYINNGMMFRVQASTRIDSTLNDALEEQAKKISTRQTLIQVSEIDPSIPTHEIRTAESNLRVRLIQLATAEAEKLGGTVSKISFNDPTLAPRGQHRMEASFSNSYSPAALADGGALGHSEKIYLSATVSIKTSQDGAEAAGNPKIASNA